MTYGTNKYKWLYGFLIFLVTGALIALGVFYVQKITAMLEEDTENNLLEVAEQSADSLQAKMQNDIFTLYGMASFIANFEDINSPEVMDVLRNEANRNQFTRLAVTDTEGRSTSTDGTQSYVKNRDYYQKALTGEASISDVIISSTDNITKEIIYAVPIEENGLMKGVLRSVYTVKELNGILASPIFNGKGQSYIVKANGDRILSPSKGENTLSFDNLFDKLSMVVSQEALSSMKNDMANGKRGVFNFVGERNIHNYMAYVPVEGINDWYSICVIPASVASKRSAEVIRLTFIIEGIIVVLFLFSIGYVVAMKDKARRILYNIAFMDPLTKLSNWQKFCIEAPKLITEKNCYFVVFDVDNFKLLNDLYGYDRGSEVLQFIADKTNCNLKDGEYLTRIASDNFAMLLKAENEKSLIRRINEMFDKIIMEASEFNLRFSCGICLMTDKNTSMNIYSDRANMARKSIKSAHINTCAVYDEAIRERLLAEKEIEDHMKEAMSKGEFVVYYQPKYDLHKECLWGAEALVRWCSPEKGLISPGEFIPIFEKNGFILKLDLYVLEQVCIKIRQWLDMGIEMGPISVNLSRVHLNTPDLIKRLTKITQKYKIPPRYIDFELTESAIYDNENRLLSIMGQLKDIGFGLSMDDFGTGYSSLNLLKNLPIDILKMDKGFLDGCDHDECELREKTILEDVILMAKHLNITVLMEGVETETEVEFLKNTGCDLIQGYYFARPMPVIEYEKILIEIGPIQ